MSQICRIRSEKGLSRSWWRRDGLRGAGPAGEASVSSTALVCDAAIPVCSVGAADHPRHHRGGPGQQADAIRPEVLAYHMTLAQGYRPGDRQMAGGGGRRQCGANDEAVAHIGKAIRLLEQIEDAVERKNRELSLLLSDAPIERPRGSQPERSRVPDRAILLSRPARMCTPSSALYNQWVINS